MKFCMFVAGIGVGTWIIVAPLLLWPSGSAPYEAGYEACAAQPDKGAK